MNTPKLRALRVATLSPLQGATPVARQSRFHGVPGLGHFMPTDSQLCVERRK